MRTPRRFSHKWIEDRPLAGGDWSRNRNQRLDAYLSERDLLHILVSTVSRGGNLHLALTPYADGTIPFIEQERLRQLVYWLAFNGEKIHGTMSINPCKRGAAFLGRSATIVSPQKRSIAVSLRLREIWWLMAWRFTAT